MSTKISYTNLSHKTSLSTKDLNIFLLDKDFTKQIGTFTKDSKTLVTSLGKSKFKGHTSDSYITDVNGSRVFCIGTNVSEVGSEYDLEFVGSTIAKQARAEKSESIFIYVDSRLAEDFSIILEAILLKSYAFDKYKSKKSKFELKSICVYSDKIDTLQKSCKAIPILVESVYKARDFMNEPSNVLYPAEYAKRISSHFKNTAVKVKVLGEKEIKKLKMDALYGVGKGSRRESQVVVMQYMPKKGKGCDLALIGKGVTFDTGGISLKPGRGMEEMKFDMGGSAACIGAMLSIAKQKLPINVVCVVGLVENMPDGDAYRPGDILGSMAGKTIEILNTDAEGRLVLADILHYAQKFHKPKEMIDFATLTGAMDVALGSTHSGFFTHDDKFAQRLEVAGVGSRELTWRMPFHHTHHKTIKSPVADLRNLGTGPGATTAAEFLAEFVDTKKVVWAHIDIAGTSMIAKENYTSNPGGTAVGVRLVDRFVKDTLKK